MKISIAKDSTINLNVSKVVKFLNSKCDFVKFEELSLSFQAPDKLIKHPSTHNKYLSHIKPKLESDDYVIIVTDIQYNNNYFYNENGGVIIVSFFAWKYLTTLSKENGLVYFICGMLGDEVVPWDAIDHKERLGCVNDFLFDKTRVDDGMRKGHLCNKCKAYIHKHKLTERQSHLYHDIISLLKELANASNEERSVTGNKKNVPIAKANFTLKRNQKSEKDNKTKSIFISYSHRDEKDRIKLEDHLKILQRIGMITTWTDRKITAGDEWKNQIDKNLNSCWIILLLISSNFLASDYCYDIEMTAALKRHSNNEAVAVPVILRDCLWQKSPFAKLQALPKDGKPIQKFSRKDEAYTNIAREICRIMEGA